MWERVLQLESVQDLKMKPLPQILLRYFCSRTLRAILLAMPGWQNAITRTVPEPPLPCSLGSQRPQSESRLPVRSLAYAEEQYSCRKGAAEPAEGGEMTAAARVLDNSWLASPSLPAPAFYCEMFKPTDILKGFYSGIRIYLPPRCYNEHFGLFLYHKPITLFMYY